MEFTQKKATQLVMSFFIVLCLALCTHSACLTVGMDGERCEIVQEAGERLAEDVEAFDKLLQELVLRCYEESQLITNSSLIQLKADVLKYKLKLKSTTAPIETLPKMQTVFKEMAKALEETFAEGHAKFFSLVKRGSDMVVGDSIVTNALIHFPQKTKRSLDLNDIDGKISTLQKEMSTSLVNVEKSFNKVAQHLFTLLTESLKVLVDDQSFRANLDKMKSSVSKYLTDSIHTVIDSFIERLFVLVKHSAQLVEKIDSTVASMKNNAAEITKAIDPARVLVDEAIRDLKNGAGLLEMKRKLAHFLLWMQKSYKALKPSASG